MNFVIAKTNRIANCRKPLRCWNFIWLLGKFGLPKLPSYNGNKAMLVGHRKCRYNLWDEVSKHWKKVRRETHPDVPGGSTETFAVLSAIHDEIKRRMKREGIIA